MVGASETHVGPFCQWETNTLPSSLMDSTMSPKVKIVEREGVGVRSLARNILRVERHVKALGWGLGRLTSNLITYTNLHKPNHKLVSA